MLENEVTIQVLFVQKRKACKYTSLIFIFITRSYEYVLEG